MLRCVKVAATMRMVAYVLLCGAMVFKFILAHRYVVSRMFWVVSMIF